MEIKLIPYIVALVASLGAGRAAKAAGPAPAVRFSRDIAPILVQKCASCHSADKPKGDYRVDSFDRLMKAGAGGAAPVAAGKPAQSGLLMRLKSHDEKRRMPQKDDALPPAQIKLIEAWIEAGATFDGPNPAAPLSTLVPSAHQPHPAAPQVYPRPVPILALAFHPDGKSVAAGGYHEITIWDPAGGRLLRRIGNVARQTHALAWSPDGSSLAVAGGAPGAAGEVRVVSAAGDSRSTAASRLLERIGDVMLCVSFSPDGTRLAAGGTDGAVRVFDLSSGKRALLIEQHADWVTAVAFSPDGTRIASASRDKSARVFDATSGEAHGAYLGHEAPVFAVAWAEDGTKLYSGGRDQEVHAWEPKTEAKKPSELGGFGGDVLRLSVVGDSVFSASADGKVRRHRTARDNALVRTYDTAGEWAYGLAVHKGAGQVAAGRFDGSVRVFGTEDGAPLSTFIAAPGFVATER